jgi:hypothetical protein
MKLPRRNFLHGRGSCRAASVIAVEPGGGCCYYNGAMNAGPLARLGAFENLMSVKGGPSIHIRDVWTVRHQPARCWLVTEPVDCR